MNEFNRTNLSACGGELEIAVSWTCSDGKVTSVISAIKRKEDFNVCVLVLSSTAVCGTKLK